jgi:ubiquinone/menaquinone biosynthesis C-methylase UbiE
MSAALYSRAHHMPFDDETFDAVCCFGALYLVPEPFAVAAEMVRVLRPGGRIAMLTSYAGQTAPIRRALTAGADVIGLTMFDAHTFVD